MPTKATIEKFFDHAIQVHQKEIDAILARKEYFMRQYGTAFGSSSELVSETQDA